TVSSWHLAEFLGLEGKPISRVPHARARVGTSTIPRQSQELRVGFMGTVRAHKGVGRLVELVRRRHEFVGVTFRQRGWSPPADLAHRWVEIDADTPLEVAYARLDAVVVPMDSDSRAATHQLPAKLMDALANNVPAFVTSTPPIRELVGEGVHYIKDWDDV